MLSSRLHPILPGPLSVLGASHAGLQTSHLWSHSPLPGAAPTVPPPLLLGQQCPGLSPPPLPLPSSPGMVEEHSCGEGDNPVTLGTEPAPVPACCLAAAQDCNRKVPPLPQLFCGLREAVGQSPEGTRHPMHQCAPGKDNFLGKAGKQSQMSPVSRQRTK